MSDLPLDRKSKKVNEVPVDKPTATVVQPPPGHVTITHENADILTVHFLSQIFGRLGYIIKLLEEKK